MAVEAPRVEAASGPPPFFQQVTALPWPFWATNIMEMIERLAYYGVRVVIPIYIAQADEPGGLHFSQEDKGVILAWWALVQTLLPMFTGGLADRYGYKQQIVVAIVLKAIGYVVMATQRDFWGFFTGCMILGAGTAVFKPPIQGTFVRTLSEKNSGVGWGVFYMVVNVGGFLGPPLAHFLYGYSWPVVFYGCAALVSLNVFWLFTYREVDSGADRTMGFGGVMLATFWNLWNAKLVAFIVIMSFFWAGFMQLFDMMPNFIADWVDSSALAVHVPAFMLSSDTSRGPQITQEWLININPFMIVLLVVPISWFVNRKMRRLTSIFVGIIVASVGILAAGYSMIGAYCLLGIVLFSFGEMLSSPKMNEYLGVIAPADKKALYMGYANIPHAVGWFYGSYLAGETYGEHGEKAALALRYLEEQLHVTELPERTEALGVLMSTTGWDAAEATRQLWAAYSPSQVWTPFAIAGFISALALIGFNRWVAKSSEANA